MLSFDSAKLLLFSYSYSMLNETEMEIAIRLLALALNNDNNIKIYTCTYNNYYENYLRFQKGWQSKPQRIPRYQQEWRSGSTMVILTWFFRLITKIWLVSYLLSWILTLCSIAKVSMDGVCPLKFKQNFIISHCSQVTHFNSTTCTSTGETYFS